MKKYITEEQEWLNLTPAERIAESGKLWKLYLSLGGSLDPEPDPQSPFYFSEIRRKRSSHQKKDISVPTLKKKLSILRHSAK